MSASWMRVLGLVVVSACLSSGCSKGMNIHGSDGAAGGGTGGSVGPELDAATPDLPAPALVTVDPAVLDFGTVELGQTSATPSSVTVTNLGPATSLTPQIVGAQFSLVGSTCSTLPAGGTCTISMSFTPTATGPAAGTLVVTGTVMVTLTGFGNPPADFTMTDKIDLGTVLASASVSGKVTITATNPLGDLLCSAQSAGNVKADPITTTCPATGILAKGAICFFGFTFSSSTPGLKSGDEIICTGGGITKFTPIIATVIEGPGGCEGITGGPDLGTVALGETGPPVTFTIRNTGGTDATGIAVGTNNTAFVIGNDGCTGTTLVKTTGTCTFTLTFEPAATGITGGYAGLLTESFTGGNLCNLPITATAIKPATDGGVVDSSGAGDGHTGDTSGPKLDAAISDGPASVLVTVYPLALDLGSVDVGRTSSAPSSVKVTNLGPPTSLTPQIVPVPSPFTLAGNTCNVLPANGTCTISVIFTPTVTGPAAGTLVVAGTVAVGLAGFGSSLADFTQTDHVDLGTVLVGASVSGKVTVTATNSLSDLMCAVSSAGNLKADPTTTTCPTVAPGALAAGASCFFGFTFRSSTAGAKTGDEIICSSGSVTKLTSITAVVASPAKLLITPLAASTAATTGKSNTITFTVANGGDVKTGAITAAITPANPEFVVSGTTCTVGLLPLGTCTVTVTFQPTTDGTKTATLTVTDSGAPAAPVAATLTGVATAPTNLTITGGPDLGTVALGETGTPVTFTVTNTGGTDAAGVTVSTNNTAFVIGNDGCTGQTLAKTTGSCTLTLTFAPAATGIPGVYSGLLRASSTGGSPFNLPITATATIP